MTPNQITTDIYRYYSYINSKYDTNHKYEESVYNKCFGVTYVTKF